MRRTIVGGAATRRAFLGHPGLGHLGLEVLALGTGRAVAGDIRLPLPGEPRDRALTRAVPQKGAMIPQRTRPPLPRTPFAVFDEGVFTPDDRFFVRWP